MNTMRKTLSALVLFGLCACATPSRDDCRVSYYRQKGVYRLINPLLDVDEKMDFSELRSLRLSLTQMAAQKAASDGISHVAVYFRDLNRGSWFGINDKEAFAPASLFKVPIMMVILKKAEEDGRGLLQSQLAAVEPRGGSQSIPPAEQVQPGKTYSIEELLRLMIVHSDNRAHSVLLDYMDSGGFRHLFEDLDLPPTDERARDAFLSVKEYASFFRVLYNASYLSRSMSTKALELLTQTTFKDGLVAGLPPGVLVAHKFGERIRRDKPEKQLHDCGIVYHPRIPYLICVMTRGESFEKQAAVIKDVSAQVYAAVDAKAN
jgi:beta-lactamase class A